MPLPKPETRWPPPEWGKAKILYDKWGAWYSGNVDELAKVYASATTVADSRQAGAGVNASALVTMAPRRFWGVAPPQGSMRLAKLHVPLAGDIASTSADLLFGEPPDFRVPDAERPDEDPTQRRIDVIVENGGLHATLHEAAETSSAYGGVYLRVGWDKQIADHVLIDALPPDVAVPEWRSGRLTAVTFWRELPGDDKAKWRHLERHEPGVIWHGLYRSTGGERLGEQRNLKDHPDTEAFAALADGTGKVPTGAKGLTAEYVPNMRPNRRMRGSLLGRSDYDGIEALLDGLDEAWSSWMRDLRIGKGRLIVPEVYLQSQGRGRGAMWDAEQEVYQAVAALPNPQQGLALQVVQFQIRVAEHEATTKALMAQAVRGAGYSAGTFGEDSDGPAPTATEITARWRRSFSTRNRKIEYFRAPLARLWETALQVDAEQFGSKVTPVRPDIEWPDGVAVDPEQQARTLQLLEGAKAVSTRTKVAMLHPDWDDTRIDKEADDIDKAGMPPPMVPPPGAAAGGDLNPEGQGDGKPPAADKQDSGQPKRPGRVPARRRTPVGARP